ncbi:MAG: class I SAM-dependent methyltransferase [Rhodobacteraceae bacterium]|nr:class I SAM-dependent methyltransferase [Paracoccaceae bacterium]
MDWDAFFTVHRELHREGPGLPEDVAWALAQLGASPARVLDAACGPGADTQTLARLLPDASIDAVEKQAHFVDEARARLDVGRDRVRLWQGDMFDLSGAYDLIWCAGAAYFVGVTEALTRWRPRLAAGGFVAFSEPVLEAGASDAAQAFWEEYPAITDRAGIEARVRTAGYAPMASRLIQGAAWQAYYAPMEARIAALRAQGVSAAVEAACFENLAEAERWRAGQADIAYLLVVARPDP